MGYREFINKRPMAATVAGAILVLLGISFIGWQVFGGSSRTSRGPAPMFYSDDDGQTCFVAATDKLPPFDHNGKTAVYAHVFKCGTSGQPFIAYLTKYGEDKTSARAIPNEYHPILLMATRDEAMFAAVDVYDPELPISPTNLPGRGRTIAPSPQAPSRSANPEAGVVAPLPGPHAGGTPSPAVKYATMLAKKPHAALWIADSATTHAEYERMVSPACPKGESGSMIQVDPSDPANGIRRE